MLQRFSQRLPLFIIGTSLFLIFVLFSYLVHENVFTQFDFDMTVRMQDNIPRRFDDLFSFFSEVGKFEPMLIVLLVLLVTRRKLWGIIAFMLFGFFHVFELFGKYFVEHTPPPHFMLRTKHLMDFPQFHVRLENSYPSGHAGRSAFLTVFVGIWVLQSGLKNWQKAVIISILLGYDIVMWMSRPYLGEHWTTDVIGGTLLGLSMGILSSIMYTRATTKTT